MPVKRINLMPFFFLFSFYSFVFSQEDFSFDNFLAELVKEIDTQIKKEENELESSPAPKEEEPITKEKEEEIFIERAKDLKTDFINEFPPAPKPGEKATPSESKKLKLPLFKSEALEFYLSMLSKNINDINKNIAGLDEFKRKKFTIFQKNIGSFIETIDKISSNSIYHPILYEKAFNNLRKKIVTTAEKVKKLNSDLSIALTASPKNIKDTSKKPNSNLIKPHNIVEKNKILTKKEKKAFGAMKLSPSATPNEILGIVENASINEIRNAYSRLMEQWRSPKDLKLKKIASTVRNIINNAYETLLFGTDTELYTPAGVKLALDKIEDFFIKELPNLSSEVKKVLDKSGKLVSAAKSEQEKLAKSAQARLSKLEKTRPSQSISFGRDYEGESYTPRTTSKGSYEQRGSGHEAPFYGEPSYEGYGEPYYGSGFGDWQGGGFGSDNSVTSGFEKSGMKENKSTKGEEKKEEPASKTPEKLEGDEAREANIKNSVIDLSKKLKNESDKDKIEELLDDIEANTNTLATLQIGLDPKRKKNLKWKDLNEKYKNALETYKSFNKKRTSKPKDGEEDKEEPRRGPIAVEASEEKEKNIKEAVIDLTKQLESTSNKEDIKNIMDDIELHTDVLKKVQVGLDPMRKKQDEWISLDKKYKNSIKTFDTFKEKIISPMERPGESEFKTSAPFQALEQLDKYSNELQNKFSLAQGNTTSLETFLFSADKKLAIANRTYDFDSLISSMKDLEVNLRQLNNEFNDIEKNGNSLLSNLRNLVHWNPKLKTESDKVSALESKLRNIVNTANQLKNKLSDYDFKRRALLDKAAVTRQLKI